MPLEISIRPGGLDDPHVIELLGAHVSMARAQTAPGSAHALDLSELRSSDIRFWSAWNGQDLLGTAALKRLSASHGEIKSMHTAEAFRRRGIASALLRHVIDTAKADGLTRVSLETGSWEYFRAARSLYAYHGFVECGPFGDYLRDPNSVFMTLDLNLNPSTK